MAVDLLAEPRRLVVVVENAMPATTGRTAPGYGLVGMRERAALVGGRLEAGPTAAGSWRVRLELPVEADVAAAAPGAPGALGAPGAPGGPGAGVRPPGAATAGDGGGA